MGKPIAEHQAIDFMLADMAMGVVRGFVTLAIATLYMHPWRKPWLLRWLTRTLRTLCRYLEGMDSIQRYLHAYFLFYFFFFLF